MRVRTFVFSKLHVAPMTMISMILLLLSASNGGPLEVIVDNDRRRHSRFEVLKYADFEVG